MSTHKPALGIPGLDLLRVKAFEQTDASRLFVFIHGYSRRGARTKAVRETVECSWKDDVDFLAPTYHSGLLSNADPCEVARQITELISRVVQRGSYDSVTLAGFSAGALLIRKALVYGYRSLEDHPFPEQGVLTARDWSRSVIPKLDRVVLFAGMNRGWSYGSRPRQMSRWRFTLTKLGTLVGRLRLAGRFLMDLERGRPFVANLRVQWIRLHQSALGQSASSLPTVIQLLGDDDDVVRREDNKDLLIAKDFMFIPVVSTGHRDIFKFGACVEGRNRYDLIAAAVSQPLDQLRSEYADSTERLRIDEFAHLGADPKMLVFLMHGIRANADWPNLLTEKIHEREASARCVRASYGYFPMLRFLLFGSRRRNVRWFMDEYTEALAKAGHPLPTHFVGHSNGTHLLAEALHRYATVNFDRVALMGSVVPSHFRWDRYADAGRVKTIRNDRGRSDFVVGVFPGFLQRLGTVIPVEWFKDVGDGGFRGFRHPARHHAEHFYLKGGHAAAYRNDKNLESIADFIVSGQLRKPRSLRKKPSFFADYVSRLNWVVWAVLSALLIGGGVAVLIGGSGWWLVAYVVVVMLLLLTV